MPTVKTIYISFSLVITSRQIPQWRGAFVEMAGREYELLHNHDNSSGKGNYHYRYPRIQYRMHEGKAAIFAIGEGVEVLQEVLKKGDWTILWEQKEQSLHVEKVMVNDWNAQILPHLVSYSLTDWIALSQKSLPKWNACKGLGERVVLLERILTNHIVASCYGIDWKPEEHVEVVIQDYSEAKVRARGVTHKVFHVVYKTNIELPPHISIGKSVSVGFGWQVKI